MGKLKKFLRSGNCKCGRRLRVLKIHNQVFYYCKKRHWYNFWMHEKFAEIIRLNPIKKR